jgi:hypothetical protein
MRPASSVLLHAGMEDNSKPQNSLPVRIVKHETAELLMLMGGGHALTCSALSTVLSLGASPVCHMRGQIPPPLQKAQTAVRSTSLSY